MKKLIFCLVIVSLVFPLVSCLELDIIKTSENEVMIAELDKPAVFDLEIKNLGPDENIEFYNLLGFRMFPIGTVSIKSFETKEIELKISPLGDFDYLGAYTFTYFIKGVDSEIQKTLTFKRIKLEDAFEIGGNSFDPESNSVEIYIKNKENFNFGEIKVDFSSAFFDFEESFELGEKETKKFNVELNKEDFKELVAGFYNLNAEIKVGEIVVNIEDTLKFDEKSLIKTEEENYGFIVQTKIIKKTNEGNVVALIEQEIKKNIISRLFTSFEPTPDRVERNGFSVYYTWNEKLNPGEILDISVKTNWIFPLLIVLVIVGVVVLAKQSAKTNLVLKKKVSFVKTKGGEFALKISLYVNAKKYLENVNIVERLPRVVKIYEKFGIEAPSKVDTKANRLEWNFSKLEAGEIRLINYVVYSKVGLLGKFALPSAKAIYEKNGEIHEAESNRAFFLSEQKGKSLEEE